jgi:type IV pilus assembly protein PilE
MSTSVGRKGAGFTLLELLIVVAVISILAAIAFPSYRSYTLTARRVDGQASLQRVLLEQEKWRANHATYASSLTDLGMGSGSADGHYTLALSGVTGTGFTATATAATGGSQTADTACAAMTLTLNELTVTNAPAACWRQ